MVMTSIRKTFRTMTRKNCEAATAVGFWRSTSVHLMFAIVVNTPPIAFCLSASVILLGLILL